MEERQQFIEALAKNLVEEDGFEESEAQDIAGQAWEALLQALTGNTHPIEKLWDASEDNNDG